MASLVSESSGRRYVQLSPSEHPARPKFRLGRVPKRDAGTTLVHIERLVRSKTTGGEVPPATAEWLAGVPTALRRRLERFGLVAPQERQDCPPVAEWVAKYIAGRQDVKESTRLKYRQAEAKLLGFFDGARRLDEITPGDVDEFRVHLKTACELSEETVRSRMASAKLFFAAAVRKRIIHANPFDGQATASRGNPKREYFVTPEEAQKVLEAIPDAGLRLVFALARYGGLRVPSEVQALTWADVHWGQKRFTVHASKTEHHEDAGIRQVPIFPELEPYLMDAFDEAEEGAVYCCPQHGPNAGQVYRKYVVAAIERAGLKPWPKLFQNCRATRETELSERFPIHTVTAWIGNSPRVAQRHYLQVTEDHYARAVQKTGQDTGQDTGQQSSAGCRKGPKPEEVEAENDQLCGVIRDGATERKSLGDNSLGDTGLEPTGVSASGSKDLRQVAESNGAGYGAFSAQTGLNPGADCPNREPGTWCPLWVAAGLVSAGLAAGLPN